MKKFFLIGFCVICICSVFLVAEIGIAEVKSIPEVIKSSAVYADVPQGAVVYNSIDGKAIDLILSGGKVEILEDRSQKWYLVRYKNKIGWVKVGGLNIPKDSQVNTAMLAKKVIVDYANVNFESKTEHFVWVDIDRQRVYILKGQKGNWSLEKTIVCATGKNVSPTVRGNFEIGDRGEWFYSQRLGSGAMYWVRFKESYLFHSVAMDENKNIVDNVLGQKRSSGCVRMSVEDAKWFYDNIERNTGVWVY